MILQNKKDTSILKAKSLDLEISDYDTKTRTVSGYLSSFDVLDSDTDIIRKGAFLNSIAQKGVNSSSNRQIAHLWNHDWAEPVGKFTELYEDDYGLKFVSKMGRSDKARDVFYNYQDGILKEHSVGFYYVEKGTTWKAGNNGGHWEITEVDLLEGSTVTFGSNSFTNVIDVSKSEQVVSELSKINAEMDNYMNILRNGQGTDERFYEVEMGMKTLQAKYSELFSKFQLFNNVKSQKIEETPKIVEKKDSNFKRLINQYLN